MITVVLFYDLHRANVDQHLWPLSHVISPCTISHSPKKSMARDANELPKPLQDGWYKFSLLHQSIWHTLKPLTWSITHNLSPIQPLMSYPRKINPKQNEFENPISTRRLFSQTLNIELEELLLTAKHHPLWQKIATNWINSKVKNTTKTQSWQTTRKGNQKRHLQHTYWEWKESLQSIPWKEKDWTTETCNWR